MRARGTRSGSDGGASGQADNRPGRRAYYRTCRGG